MTYLTGGAVLAFLLASVLAIALAWVIPAPFNYGIAVGGLLTAYFILTTQKRKNHS